MKSFFRSSLLTCFSLFLVAQFQLGLTVPSQILNLIWSGILIHLLNLLVKPVIKLLLLPLNLITLGLFSWLANVLVLLIAVNLIPGLSVNAFTLSSINYAGFITPLLSVNRFFALIIISLFLSLIYNFLDRLLVEE